MMNHSQPQGADYNYTVVRQFALTTVLWGIVGMAVGVLIAAQLIWPQLNFETPWLTYSRLRPLHTTSNYQVCIMFYKVCFIFVCVYYF